MNYALNIPDNELLATLIALKELNHTELHNKLESGILLAFQEIGGFSDTHNKDLFSELVIHEQL